MDFEYKLLQMLKGVQPSGNRCSCHLHGKYVLAGCFWQPYTGQGVGKALDVIQIICGVEEQAAIQNEMSTWLRKRVMKTFFTRYT